MIDQYIWRIIELTTSVFEIVIAYMFLKDFLGKTEKPKISKAMGFLLFLIVSIVSNNFFNIDVAKLVGFMLGTFLLSFVFGGDLKLKLFSTVLFTGFMLISETLAFLGIISFVNINAQVALEDNTPKLLGIIISKIISLIIVKVVCYFKKKENVKIPLLTWVPLMFVPVISTITLYVIFEFYQITGLTDITVISLLAAIGLLFVNILIFYLFESILDKTSVKMHNSLLEQQIEYQTKHFEELECSQNETRKIRHDMKNHMLCLFDFAKNKKCEEAVNYIENLIDSIEDNGNKISTGNPALDAMLNAKIMQAKKHNITVNTVIEIPSNINIQPIDFCVILGNSLDNAIEACNRIEGGDKNIDIILAFSNDKLIYKITNTTNGKVKKSGKFFITSKGDLFNHGLGLENIERVVLKNNGTLNIEHSKDNIFELSIVI